jgi:hypothetical protein
MPRKRRLQQIPDGFLRCKVLGHDWDDVSGTAVARTNKLGFIHGRRKSFRCSSCTTVKHEVWSLGKGEMIERDYLYPDGYLRMLEGESDLTPRQEARLEMLAREKVPSARAASRGGSGN